jgi:hypothetical protein
MNTKTSVVVAAIFSLVGALAFASFAPYLLSQEANAERCGGNDENGDEPGCRIHERKILPGPCREPPCIRK